MLREISAEMLLEYLYPGSDSFWKANCRGTFYRNYNDDCLSFNPETGKLNLARDGFLKTLPDGLFNLPDDSSKKNTAKDKDAAFQYKLVEEAFSPFDTFAFRDGLKLERIISSLLQDKIKTVLKDYFDIDLDSVSDPLVREAAMFLPMVRNRRGNPFFVKLLFESILHCEVRLDLSHRYSDCESDKTWIPKAIFELNIPDMSPEQFKEKLLSLKPLCDFVKDRFLPFDMAFELIVRDSKDREVPEDLRCLDYNLQMR